MKTTIMKLFVLALGSCLKPQDILHITSISYVFITIKYSYRLHFMNAHLVITDSITTLLYVIMLQHENVINVTTCECHYCYNMILLVTKNFVSGFVSGRQ